MLQWLLSGFQLISLFKREGNSELGGTTCFHRIQYRKSKKYGYNIGRIVISFFIYSKLSYTRLKFIAMNQRHEFRINLLISFGILNIICLTLIFSALSFSIKQSITRLHFPLAVCSSLAINYFASKYYFQTKYKSVYIKTTGILLALVILSTWLGASIYDTSWDGQAYHKEALIQLKEGWNPFYKQLPSTQAYSIFLNHYGKGAEIPQGVIYAFLNRIEAGKATNALLTVASFCLCAFLLAGATKLSTFKIYLFSALFALNPIAVNQMFTYYVDGQLASLLCVLIITSCLLFNNVDKYGLALLCSIVIITVNIKFTAIGFVGVLMIGLLVALLYTKKIKQFKRVLIAAAISSIIGICFVGFNPYITNTIYQHEPFYPLAGKSAIDIMESNAPKGFIKKNRFEKLAVSIFSHPDNINLASNRSPKLKIPFTIIKDDVAKSEGPDTRIGGFGFLFGEVVIVTFMLLISILYLCRKERSFCIGLSYIIGVLLFSVFIISEAWWARYVPQLWFVPLIILIAGESINSSPIKYLIILSYLLLIMNVSSILAISLKRNIASTIKIDYQLSQFKAVKETIIADFGPFKSLRKRFDENKIKYIEDNITENYGITNKDKLVVKIEGSRREKSKVKLGSIPKGRYQNPL